MTVLTLVYIGAGAFGLVVGWITYRTLRRSQTNGINDIAAIIGAVGGAAVTSLFPAQSEAFGAYCIGLAIGFFGYLITALVIARQDDDVNVRAVYEWLGSPPEGSRTGTPSPRHSGTDNSGLPAGTADPTQP